MTTDSDARQQVTIDISEVGVSDYALSLFMSGFPRDAVRHEAQDLLNEIQQRSGEVDLDGVRLIHVAFPDKQPLLEFNERGTDREQNDHAAFRHLMIGVVRGVRNVYSHNVGEEVTREDAAIWLGLMGKLRAQLLRSRRVETGPDDASVSSGAG